MRLRAFLGAAALCACSMGDDVDEPGIGGGGSYDGGAVPDGGAGGDGGELGGFGGSGGEGGEAQATCDEPCGECGMCQDGECVPRAMGASCRPLAGDCDLP